MVNMIDELLLDIQYIQNIQLIELFAHIYNNMVQHMDVLVFVQLVNELDNKVMMNMILKENQLVDNVHDHDMLLDNTNK
jgi:hypothetical protein